MTAFATPPLATGPTGSPTSASGSRSRHLAALAGGFAALLTALAVLAACGSASAGGAGSSASQTTTDVAPSTANSAAGNGGGSAGGGSTGGGSTGGGGTAARPGASGTIAAVQSGSFEVQSATSQTTVRYTSTTRIQQTIEGGIADVTVGSCITAVAPVNRSATTGATTAPSTATTRPSGPRNGFPDRIEPSKLTAGSVTIAAAVNGACTDAAFGGGRGAFPGGTGTGRFPNGDTRPTVAPTGPTGAAGTRTGTDRGNAGGFAGFGGIVSGKVAAVTGSTITVTVTVFTGTPRRTSGASTAAGTATTPPTTTTMSTVTVTGATTYSRTVTAKPAAIKVGLCASAVGPADDTGAITATEIRLNAPTNGSCSAGFGGVFGGRGRGSGGATGAPVTTHG